MSGLSLQKHFPFVPDYMSWDDWNGNLAIYYGAENIVFSTEEDWKTTAAATAGMVAFSQFPVPNPEEFENWQDWAREFTLIVNGPSY